MKSSMQSKVRDLLNASYKRLQNKFVVANIEDDTITIWDYACNVPYRFMAKKLIKEFGFEIVLIKVGGMDGNGWIFTKNSLHMV